MPVLSLSSSPDSSSRSLFPLLVVPDHKNQPIINSSPEEEEEDGRPIKSDIRSLYSVLQKQPIEFQIKLPSETQRFCGSSCGWLMTSTVDEHNLLHLTLFDFDPFSSKNPNCINLPPITQHIEELEVSRDVHDDFSHNLDLYYNHYIAKAVLSCDPVLNPDSYVVMIIYGSYSRLAFIKPGTDSTWTYPDKINLPFSDVIYYKDKVFAVDCDGSIFCYDVNSSIGTKLVDFPSEKFSCTSWTMKYLVESNEGDLLQVLKSYKHEETLTCPTGFRVFRLVIDSEFEEEEQWVEIKDLGDSAVFVGDNASKCVRLEGCTTSMRNSIYFTTDSFDAHPALYPLGYSDMGVYHFENESIESISYNTPVMSRQPPIWITTVPSAI